MNNRILYRKNLGLSTLELEIAKVQPHLSSFKIEIKEIGKTSKRSKDKEKLCPIIVK